MSDDSLIGRLRARGEEMFTQVSAQLMQNPQFVKAMQGALKGKQAFDEAAARALKQMNIPTRTEFKKALSRIEALERELAEQRAKAARKSTARAGKRGARGAKSKSA
jgi:hypothetical protein